jgi:AcrR family transcriptional regulator
MVTVPNPASDAQRVAIIDAAFQAFSAYGYAKTTMGDIAARAGISRPALYIPFRDKSDVFLAVAAHLHDQTARRCAAAARSGSSLTETLTLVAQAKIAAHVELVTSSPHGTELLDLNHRIGTELARRADTQFHRLLTTILRSAAASSQLDLRRHRLTAPRAATLIATTLDGFERAILEQPLDWQQQVATIVAVLVHGLS